MEQNIVLGNKRKFVFHFLSSLFFISAISLFEIGGIYSFIYPVFTTDYYSIFYR